jgi:hypothetical protein
VSQRLSATPVGRSGLHVLPAACRRPLSVGLLIASLPSCYRYQELGPTPQAALQNPPESTLYVTRAGGSTVELREVAVIGDSVVGLGVPVRQVLARPRIAIPLSDVSRVRTRKLDAGKTAGLVGGMVAGAILLFVGIYALTYEDPS